MSASLFYLHTAIARLLVVLEKSEASYSDGDNCSHFDQERAPDVVYKASNEAPGDTDLKPEPGRLTLHIAREY